MNPLNWYCTDIRFPSDRRVLRKKLRLQVWSTMVLSIYDLCVCVTYGNINKSYAQNCLCLVLPQQPESLDFIRF